MFNFSERTERRWKLAAMLFTIVAAGSYLFLFDPASGVGYPSCPFRALTGFDCPGCGSLRGLHQLLHGNLAAAFAFNPLMALSAPFVGYSFLSYALLALRGRSLPRVFLPARVIWLLLLLVVSFGIVRNTSLYPFKTQRATSISNKQAKREIGEQGNRKQARNSGPSFLPVSLFPSSPIRPAI
ncbi:MAG: DUF2752 domain-containing protein [Pyrinomonadaceae bacterium]|nr:DUF2752 domain-containing protein [Pyrinomonadaceae bacterium]